jgi:hypothetical protein
MIEEIIEQLDETMRSELCYLAGTTAKSTETVTGDELVALGLATPSISETFQIPGVTITPLGRRVASELTTPHNP